MERSIRNPKRDASSRQGKTGWYDYYAGFSPGFVADTLNYLDPHPKSVVLDPWNGSGTTTNVAQEAGFSVVGFDINPAMIILSKAKTLDPSVANSIGPLCDELIEKADHFRMQHPVWSDPLTTWLVKDGALYIRKLEWAIQKLLVDNKGYRNGGIRTVNHISSLASFFYIGLFRAVRLILAEFRSSNPTWIKQPKTEAEKVTIKKRHLHQLFVQNISEMALSLSSSQYLQNGLDVRLEVASSEAQPLDKQSIDIVISSPPYCTRIDYAMATCIELAILGYTMEKLNEKMRIEMIGTPKIHRKTPEPTIEWGPTCLGFLKDVREHGSRASKTYYYKTYTQYFDSVFASMGEIDRVLKDNGKCVLVVQDSYYKDVHNDLPSIFVEMGHHYNWSVDSRFVFKGSSLVAINKRASRHQQSKKRTEEVLIFTK